MGAENGERFEQMIDANLLLRSKRCCDFLIAVFAADGLSLNNLAVDSALDVLDICLRRGPTMI
jgi:hypothetical protein